MERIMEIEGRQIWTHAAGDTNRAYPEICLKWDVIPSGPGYCGHWGEGGQERLRNDGETKRKIADLGRFCDQMKAGDLVILRLGTNMVFGVGKVEGGYDHHEEFNDIDGWDLGHIRRVRWLWKEPKEFSRNTLNWGATTLRLSENAFRKIRSWLQSLDVPQELYNRNLGELPPNPPKPGSDIKIEEISEHLIREGIASNSISHLLNEIGDLIRISEWYDSTDQNPSEHETITYLVVPLLRALGWTPQKMAIEWTIERNRVDVALFSTLPRDPRFLSVVVEAKRMGQSCMSAVSQAKTAAQNADGCQRIIVTDGLRYGVLKRGERGFDLYAYLNLRRLRRCYPLYGDCRGAQEALLSMTPEWQ